MKRRGVKLALLLAVAVAIYLAILAVTVHNTRLNRAKTVSLADGWRCVTAEETYEDIAFLEAIRMADRLPVGSTLTFVRTLEDMGDPDFPTIYLRTDRSAVEAYLDAEMIYEGQMERVTEDEFVGRRVRFITLPDDYAGKELRLVCHISRTGSSRGDDAPRFGAYTDCQEYYIQRIMPAVAAAVALLIFGFIFLFITLFFLPSAPEQASEIVSSVTCIVLGVWLLGFFDVTRVYITDVHSTATEYTALYLMLPLLYLWLGHMYRRMRALRIAGYAGIAMIGLMTVLHALRRVRIDDWLPFYLLMSAATFIYCLVFLTGRRRRKESGEDLTVRETGVILLTASMLIYLIVYSLQTYGILPESMLTMYIPVVGITAFVVSQIIYYFIHVSEAYALRKEFSALSHLAYVDVLTGLPNRKAAANIFERLDAASPDYAILSLDLNGLKTVNDRYGHYEGDRLLRTAAEVLNECFADIGFRARLSGDEFLVVVRRAVKEEIEERVRRMHEKFASMKSGDTVYSISCGTAYVAECETEKASDVFRLADKRMYEEKQKYYDSMH